jgi:pimeloyl-ACP methyl ester carboxylesterase
LPGTFLLPVLLLIHSPLVGSATWEPVARRLRTRRWRVIVPRIVDTNGENLPYWDRHARSVAEAIEHKALHSTVVLVGHSGAGPLLPCIAEAIDRPVAGMVFVDAGIPKNGASRLDLLAEESGVEVADKLCAFLKRGGLYPNWREAELQNLIPDAMTRRDVLNDVQPRPLEFWSEPIHVPDAWLDTPCAYLRLSHGYGVPAVEAQRRGWAYREVDAGHFHIVVDPEAVAAELVELLTSMGIGS